MDVIIITVLIIAAVILLLIELFLIPGISLAGICALGCISYANYHAFAYLGTGAGFITLTITAATCVGSLIWFMQSKALDRISLKKKIDSVVDKDAERSIRVGYTGVCTTRLALIGYAEIKGRIVEVKSIDGFLDEKTPVIVSRIGEGGMLLVEKLKQ